LTVSLDTNVVVDVTRGVASVRQRLRECLARGERVVVSAVVLEELHFGAQISINPERELDQLDDAMVGVFVEPLTAADAAAIGRYRAAAEKRGRRPSAYDALIAGHAHARVVGCNIDGKFATNAVDLHIENWRVPS
jgi:predicted nucleic acid-binding protein